jgi:hypothetical protein
MFTVYNAVLNDVLAICDQRQLVFCSRVFSWDFRPYCTYLRVINPWSDSAENLRSPSKRETDLAENSFSEESAQRCRTLAPRPQGDTHAQPEARGCFADDDQASF